MTDEQKQKAAATRAANKQAEREKWRADANDLPAALAVLRGIRDDPDASNADRIEAIKTIHALRQNTAI